MNFIEAEIDCEKFKTAVLFASYEERCTNVARHLVEKGFKGSVFIMYCDDLPPEQITINVDQMKHLFAGRNSVIPVSYYNPIPAIQFAKKLSFLYPTIIDISCFNRGNLFPFLWASGLGKDIMSEVTFAYSAPENYGDWLSADYNEPKNIVGFAGGWEFARDKILICVVGFEAQRALSVIQAAEPSKVILTVGTIPTREQFCERNQRTVEAVHGSKNYEITEINVSNPNLCKRDLQEITGGFPAETEINFAPFSTKISCLAIWALCLRDRKIRLWNAQPKTYNQLNYSKGSLAPRYFNVEWTES